MRSIQFKHEVQFIAHRKARVPLFYSNTPHYYFTYCFWRTAAGIEP